MFINLNTLAMEASHCDICKKIDSLFDLANRIENNKSFNMELALEADLYIPKSNLLDTYFSESDNVEKNKKALEEIHGGIIAAIVAGIAAIIAMIVKFIQFLRRPSINKNVVTSNEQVKEIKAIVSDHELKTAVDDAIELTNNVSLEDFNSTLIKTANHTGIRIDEVFDSFKSSLNESEVDFLTSGQRYKVIKNVIDDFSTNNFPDYISRITFDINKWADGGLQQAPHIGKDEDVVSKFITDESKKADVIKSKYSSKVNVIKEMEKYCNDHSAKGSMDHLDLFYKKPSILFPHLEHLWDSVRFERIDDEDKKLIASLEKIKKQFEENAKHVQFKLENKKQSWPAEDRMLRLIHDNNIEVMKNIGSLVKVGGFIKSAINTAYQATVKSFSFITRLLRTIGHLPNIDKDKLTKCIDVIQRKRQMLDRITTI